MDAMLGVILLSLTAILFAWSYGQFRRPQPSAWTRSDFFGTWIALAITFLFAFGAILVGKAVVTIADETRWLEIAAVLGGSILACRYFVPRLMTPAVRPAGAGLVLATSPAAAPPTPANDPHPAAPTNAGPAGRSAKRRAA